MPSGPSGWRSTELTRRLGLALPIVQAPMAGGWTTTALVVAVSEAGGLGSIAGAMLAPDALRAQIRAVRAASTKPFAVNLFAPLPAPSDRGLAEWAEVSGVPLPTIPAAGARFADQLTVVIQERVPVLSFTFGAPDVTGVDCFTIGTATTAAEAKVLVDNGADAVLAQGYEAGGHRGTFLDPVELSLVGTLALVPQILDVVSVPVIASGGVMNGRGIAAARALGAAGVQLGTAFLASDEAAVPAAYRAALGRPSTVTSVLTGRPARAVRTPLVQRLEDSGVTPPDYPLPRLFLTEPPFLVGQGGPLARPMPAGELVSLLAAEADAAVAALAASPSTDG
ncbi:MAG: nitronate monooxygenase [Nakamurella sp.]